MQELSPTKIQSTPPIRILLIEDDAGDAYLVRDLLETGPEPTSSPGSRTWPKPAGLAFDVRLCAPRPRPAGLPGPRCASTLLDFSPGLAVVVLTGLDDQLRGGRPSKRARRTT